MNETFKSHRSLEQENLKLQQELDAMKENVLVSSLNDMKDVYAQLEKKYDELQDRYEKNLMERLVAKMKVSELTKKNQGYRQIAKQLVDKSQRTFYVVNTALECIEEHLEEDEVEDMESLPSEQFIHISEQRYRGIRMTATSVLDKLRDYVQFDYPDDRRCIDDNCGGCHRSWCTSN